MENPRHGGRKFLYFTVLTVYLVAFTTGICLTWTSPIIPKLKIEGNPLDKIITEEEGSWIGSLLALGAAFGPPIAGFSADKFGRRITLLALAVPLLVSFVTLAFAESVPLYYSMRFLAGLSVGSTFTVLPMYIAEISEDSIRGTLSSILNVLVTSGTLFSYIVGAYVPILWYNLICAVFPAIFLVIFFLFIPESPYYLAKKRSVSVAELALQKFRSCEDFELKNELASIRTNINEEKPAKFSEIFMTRGNKKALFLSIALMSFQQFSGINAIQFYAQDIFKASGESSLKPEISAIIIGVTQVAASFITPIFVDRLGRKILLLISSAGMLLFEVAIGAFFYLYEQNHDMSSVSWLPILCLVGYILTYNTGYGPLPWVVMAELFPGNIKSSASALVGSYCWFIGFLMTKFFAPLADLIHMSGSFWLFSSFNVVALILVPIYLPETKGKSIHEIVKQLNK